MYRRIIDRELLSRKRQLRLRIGRARRRIDGRLRTSEDSARQLLSWRMYVVRYPAWSLAAALGLGLAAAGIKPQKLSRRLGMLLISQGLGGIKHRLWAELLRIWNDAGAQSQGSEQQ
jgi:hypothetical protein